MKIEVAEFGKLPGGETVHSYLLRNSAGAEAMLIDYGAVLVRLLVPGRDGRSRDVVLGYDSMEGYLANPCFFGAVIGPNGNRIAGAAFKVNGTEYHLQANENTNNLHSGPDGFEKKLWQAEPLEKENAVRFSRVSPDGENGFPGNFSVSVTYTLTEDNTISLTYEGTSDLAGIANMTNHTYFNLNGEGSGTILDQFLLLNSHAFTPVIDSASIPTGEIRAVEGTVMDFTAPHRIGERIDADDVQLAFTGGYDHNFVVDGYAKGQVGQVARAWSDETGIRMTVTSDCPCVQFYAGNFIKSENGKNGHIYTKRHGFCLETQVEPNAVNEPSFHSPVIQAGERYLSRTAYHFDIKES